ncbi:MAG TPA: DJ-1/PfpI family protein [Chitinophagaceae bacterium]|jgi:putative intracellular protease/amidase
MKHFMRELARLLLSTTTLMFAVSAHAQQKQDYNVAIFLYNNVELLDFAGPGEVFASTRGFHVYTVSADGKEILSQGFVTVKPEYSIDNSPTPDIIVFPGGNTSAVQKDKRVLDWVKKSVADGNTAMSVCSGAGILAKAGLLEGLNVTTHHGFIPGLQEMLPNSKVLEKTRFVDNGNIITTAGVSAGIDGALHMVARIKGLDVADATAWYMEYEKWDHTEGKVDYKNSYLEKMKASGAAQVSYPVANESSAGPVPYEGELKNLAKELWDKGMYEKEAKLLEDAIKWYPDEGAFYSLLADVNEKLGKPAPMNETAFIKLLDDGKVDEAITAYNKAAKEFPGWKIFSEDALNQAGYRYMQKGDFSNAIKIFQLNVSTYPNSGNVYDSLGEGFLKSGDKKNALAYYQKSLQIDPANTNAKEVLKTLQ